MDIFFPHTFRERVAFKESAVKCGFVELTAETTANVGILPADERISTLLMAWENISNYLTRNPYNHDVGITVSWVCRCTLNLWFGREWIACAIENKTDLIEQMMKVYPTAFITIHPYSWPYMFSIYRDPWMVEYLNLNFQRMSGSDLTPILEPKDSEFIQQEGIPLLILRMVNMFDFRMVKLVKYMCLRLLLTWQDENSTASRTLRSSPNADQYIDYARHIYMLSICESNGFKDLHYTLETIQRVVHCDLTATWPLELGAHAIAKGLQESNKTLTELLIAFLFKVPKSQFENMFGAALNKYISFLTEYQLRNINRISSVNLPWPVEEVYSKLVEMFIAHRESSEDLIKTTSKISEQIFLGLKNLAASKCAYELIKQRSHAEWYTSKITLLLTIIGEEINIIQDYKYNDVQSTDELIEKEKEVAIYYRDLAKLFHKSPYLEQEAWLTTFSLHPCREFMDAVTRCGARNLRAIKKHAHKLKVIDTPESKTKIKVDKEAISHETIVSDVSDTGVNPRTTGTSTEFVKTFETVVSTFPQDSKKPEVKPIAKKPPRKKTDKNGPKKIEPKINEKSTDKTVSNMFLGENQTENKNANPSKRGRPVGALNKDTKSRSRPPNSARNTAARYPDEKPDLAEEIFAAAAGAAENINSQTAETIKYPAFALMNSVTDTEELMKFTNYDEAYEQYTELNKILTCIKLNHNCHEDLLILLIAPRYKRLTWAVSWKKLKKRCRVILTKDNKKRELVEQSMADANDRLTHLNIDYEKYKDKPQIDYGTIEGGYECYDTDSNDDIKSGEVDVKRTNERQIAKKNAKKLVDSTKEAMNINRDQQNLSITVKPYLKIENLDSSSSNLLNIIESTHLSKPVYLNKPVYFVRNIIANLSSETAISLETGPENKPSSRTSSRRSTGEETLTSDSFEEHHWHLTTTDTTHELRQSSQEQGINISQLTSSNSPSRAVLKTEMAFNIPASIRQQLEQPAMFFKSESKKESDCEANMCKEENPHNFQTDKPEALNLSPPKETNLFHNPSRNQIEPILSGSSRFSPILFEDMPEDLTMPKLSNIDLYENDSPLQSFPLNLTSTLVTGVPSCKKISLHKNPLNQGDKSEIKRPLKRGTKQPPRSLNKINSRKRQLKEGVQYLKNESFQDLKIECASTQVSSSQESSITPPSSSLKSVRILTQNKKSKAIRINPTAAVVFSSAAASYHRTPFLNAAQHEPNILQQLLLKENKPFGSVDNLFDKSIEIHVDGVSETDDKTSSEYKLDSHTGTFRDTDTTNLITNSKLEVSKGSCLSDDTSETSNSKTHINAHSKAEIIKKLTSSKCDNEQKKTLVYKAEVGEELQNAKNKVLKFNELQANSNASADSAYQISHSSMLNTSVSDGIQENITANSILPADEPSAPTITGFSTTDRIDSEFFTNNIKELHSTMNTANFLDQLEDIKDFNSLDFEFKVPAAVVRPCFFMRSKHMKANSCASDWVKNILFNEKTAEIVFPITRKNYPASLDLKNDVEANIPNAELKKALNEMENKSINSVLQGKPGDILYDKHIVFNTKLLDPHLKTYKNTKAPCKFNDTKKLEESFSETDDFFSGKSEELNVGSTCLLLDFKYKQLKEDSLPISNSFMSDSLPGQQSTDIEKNLISPLPSTSQHVVHTPRNFADEEIQYSENSVKPKKKRTRTSTPSTKKFDQMYEWLDMVTSISREPVPEHVDTSSTLFNLFSAQLMNQAKSIHFNYEYLREKEKFTERVNEEGINCEASILIASPGPSSEGVKLIKAFRKSSVFKGIDLSSNEVSFTSSLAKEVLGTIVKVTLNESENHVSCCSNHFDASDAFDDFIRSRRDVNSPTFYSPTLSMKHLRNGTLADSVECIDTSLEKFIPKPGRKRSSMQAHLPIKNKNKKRLSIDSKISNEYNEHSFAETNHFSLKEAIVPKCPVEFSETIVKENKSADCLIKEIASGNILLDQTEITKSLAQSSDVQEIKSADCSTTEIASANVSLGQTDIEKSEPQSSNEKGCFDFVHKFPVEAIPEVEYKDKITFLKNLIMKPVIEDLIPDLSVTQKEPFMVKLEDEKSIYCDLNSHEPLDYKVNNPTAEKTSRQEKIIDIANESTKSDSHITIKQKRIPVKKKQIENNSLTYRRTRRNTYEETRYILQEESETIFGPNKKQSTGDTKKLTGDGKSENETQIIREGIANENFIEENSTEEAKHLRNQEILNSAKNSSVQHLHEDIKIKNNLIKTNEVFISDKTTLLQSNSINNEQTCLNSNQRSEDEQINMEENNSSEQASRQFTEEIHNTNKSEEKMHQPEKLSEDEKLNMEEPNCLEKESTPLSDKTQNSKEIIQQYCTEEKQPLTMVKSEKKYSSIKMSSEEENKMSTVKKRIINPRISYAEIDSDSDELLRTRLKIPSLKINVPSVRPPRRKLLKRKLVKKTVLNKTTAKRPSSKRIQNLSKETKTNSDCSQKNPSLNDSDDDKPLLSKMKEDKNNKDKVNDNADYRLTRLSHVMNESDEDVPLKRISQRHSCKNKLPLLSPIKVNKNSSKYPLRKKHRNTYSPNKPSLIKFSRRRATSLNYFALFLSDTDEDEPVKPKRRKRTPDRLWTCKTAEKKVSKEPINKKISHQNKLRCSRAAIKQRKNRNPLTKPKTSIVKMPILTREDSDHTDEENIYECATMSTANETDDDACSDDRPKKRRRKVVKPMRIRCVSRRTIPADVITESSSCSSYATVQTALELGSNSTSLAGFPKRERLLRRKTLEKSLLMSKFHESSSSSSPVMMNRRKRQFAAKSTSKPHGIPKHHIYSQMKEIPIQNCVKVEKAKSAQPFTFMEKEAIYNHNCVNFQIRLQRLTANEAILCRKPYIRLDKNFVENYFTEKNLTSKELESERLSDDSKK